MTTSEEQRMPSRASVVVLVILATALAILPALRGNGEAADAMAADCDASVGQVCQD